MVSLLVAPIEYVAETVKVACSLLVETVYDGLLRVAFSLVERNLVPDFLLRRGIRLLLAARLKELKAPTGAEQQLRLQARARQALVAPGRGRRPHAAHAPSPAHPPGVRGGPQSA